MTFIIKLLFSNYHQKLNEMQYLKHLPVLKNNGKKWKAYLKKLLPWSSTRPLQITTALRWKILLPNILLLLAIASSSENKTNPHLSIETAIKLKIEI